MTLRPQECQRESQAQSPADDDAARDGEALVAVFPAVPSSVPEARLWTRTQLLDRGCTEATAHAAALLVSELATNAVRHTGTGRFTVCLDQSDGGLEIAVEDRDSANLPPIHPPTHPPDGQQDPDDLQACAEGGRGLSVVRALSDAWGVIPTHDSKWVWSRLPLTAPPDEAPPRHRITAPGEDPRCEKG